MSFSLLTALTIDDVPKILRRCAIGYRGTQTRIYPRVWRVIADEFDKFSEELTVRIAEAKANEPPPPKRERVRL